MKSAKRRPCSSVSFFKRILVFLLGTMLAFLLLPCITTAQDPPKPQSESESLEAVLQAESEALQQKRKELNELEAKLSGLAQDFQNRHEKFVPHLNKLVRLKGFVGDNFNELVIIRQFLERLRQAYSNVTLPLREALKKAEEIQASLESQIGDMMEQIQLGPPFARNTANNERLRAINTLFIKSANLKDEIQSIISTAEQFNERMNAFEQSLHEELSTAWKDFYFAPAPSIVDLKLQNLTKDINAWRQGLPVYVSYFLIGDIPWVNYLSLALVLTGLLAILGVVLMKRLHSKLPDLQLRGQGWPLFLISVTLGFLMTSWFIPGASNSVLIQTIIHAFLALGLSFLIWTYRMTTTADARPSRNLMIPLWWLFTTSLVFQGINLPESLLVSLWPFVLLVFLFMLIKTLKSIHMGLERALGFGAVISMIFLALLALSGWANISLLLSNFLFVLALSLQFGAVATSLLKSQMATLPESHLGYLGQGLIQGIGLPLLWLLAISMAVVWLGIDMGDVQFLKGITAMNIGWGALSVNLFRLILVLVGFYLARSALVVLRTLMDGMAQRHSQFDPGTTATLKTLMGYIVWAVYIFLALAFLGVNLTSLTVVAGGLSVGIGFGMQSIVNNFISGLILLFGRAIKPGDIVQIGDLWAEVKEVNIRTTVVETFDKSSLLLPNSKLIEEQIINWTLSDKAVRRTITVGVAYGSDTELVKKLLLYMADTQPNVLKRPRPFARFIDFGASSLDFRLYFFAMIDNAWDTESDLRFEIDKVFREYDIEIAFPQQDLHVKSAKGLESLFPFGAKEIEEPGEEEFKPEGAPTPVQ